MPSSIEMMSSAYDIIIFVPPYAQVKLTGTLGPSASLHVDEFTLFQNHPYQFQFQFPEGTIVCLPRPNEKACAFAHSEMCFYEASFLCGLRFPIHPFTIELLSRLKIVPGQLVPNTW